MKSGYVWLEDYGFIYERVLFISCGRYTVLFESQWEVINSVVLLKVCYE